MVFKCVLGSVNGAFRSLAKGWCGKRGASAAVSRMFCVLESAIEETRTKFEQKQHLTEDHGLRRATHGSVPRKPAGDVLADERVGGPGALVAVPARPAGRQQSAATSAYCPSLVS